MSNSDDDLQKIFMQNREDLLKRKEDPRPVFVFDAQPNNPQKNYMVSSLGGFKEVTAENWFDDNPIFKPEQSLRDFLIENNANLLVEKRVISSQRDLDLVK